MNSIVIFPVNGGDGTTFRAIARTAQADGRTAGEALDCLENALSSKDRATVVLLPKFEGDEFFKAEERQRIAELMQKWNGQRAGGPTLTSAEQADLQQLVEAEFDAAAARSAELLKGMGKDRRVNFAVALAEAEPPRISPMARMETGGE